MEDETEKIFKEQLGKLPSEVTSFLSSAPWVADLNEIGELYNLTEDELYGFKREASLVVVGLVHPDAFAVMLETEVGIKGAVLEAVVLNVEKKIFAPIRPALISFFEKEASESESQESKVESEIQGTDVPVFTSVERVVIQGPDAGLLPRSTDSQRQEEGAPSVIPPTITPSHEWIREPDVAPDNLPTAEEPESFLPPLKPKAPNLDVAFPSEEGEPTHPFEDKMKKVFTAGQQSMGDFVIEPSAPTVPTPQTPVAQTPPPVYHTDPYREPIE